MPPFRDLTNETFGNWKVLYRTDDYVSPKGHPVPRWICKCVCGKEKSITSNTLVSGESKSCGCSFGSRRKDITGQRFGKLVAQKVVGKDPINRGTIWMCQCDCGNKINTLRRTLLAGKALSCGCRGKESWIAIEVKKYFALNYSAQIEYKIIRNPKTGRYLPYDIYLPSGVFIEMQGGQHYEYVPYFFKSKNKFDERTKLDKIKKRYAKQNGIYIEVDLRKIKTVQDAIDYIEKRI